MNAKIWEVIANQCAPVLMDVKPSNLLILTLEEEKEFLQVPEYPGVSRLCLHAGERKSTWLLYRKDHLESLLLWPQAAGFLKTYGYDPAQDTVEEMLERLTERFSAYKEKKAGFPHELGVFFGYPLGDVKGFIENEGKNYLCSGYWKVYGNEQKAKKTFQLYQAVRDWMLQMLSAGSSPYEIGYQAY